VLKQKTWNLKAVKIVFNLRYLKTMAIAIFNRLENGSIYLPSLGAVTSSRSLNLETNYAPSTTRSPKTPRYTYFPQNHDIIGSFTSNLGVEKTCEVTASWMQRVEDGEED
jgi:hypothetical protein